MNDDDEGHEPLSANSTSSDSTRPNTASIMLSSITHTRSDALMHLTPPAWHLLTLLPGDPSPISRRGLRSCIAGPRITVGRRLPRNLLGGCICRYRSVSPCSSLTPLTCTGSRSALHSHFTPRPPPFAPVRSLRLGPTHDSPPATRTSHDCRCSFSVNSSYSGWTRARSSQAHL